MLDVIADADAGETRERRQSPVGRRMRGRAYESGGTEGRARAQTITAPPPAATARRVRGTWSDGRTWGGTEGRGGACCRSAGNGSPLAQPPSPPPRQVTWRRHHGEGALGRWTAPQLAATTGHATIRGKDAEPRASVGTILSSRRAFEGGTGDLREAVHDWGERQSGEGHRASGEVAGRRLYDVPGSIFTAGPCARRGEAGETGWGVVAG